MGRPQLRAGIIFTPDKTDSYLEPKPYLRLQRKQRGLPVPEQQGQIGFFRTKLWAAKIVERWEPDYGELDDPDERDRKGGHLWWWTPPADDDGEADG